MIVPIVFIVYLIVGLWFAFAARDRGEPLWLWFVLLALWLPLFVMGVVMMLGDLAIGGDP